MLLIVIVTIPKDGRTSAVIAKGQNELPCYDNNVTNSLELNFILTF